MFEVDVIEFREKATSRYLTVKGIARGGERLDILICCEGRLGRRLNAEKRETLERAIALLRESLTKLPK